MKEVIVDGTERPVQRPQNRERQKEYYSGKKKRHTCKQITVSTRNKMEEKGVKWVKALKMLTMESKSLLIAVDFYSGCCLNLTLILPYLSIRLPCLFVRHLDITLSL
ncbi:hypothetical protein C6N34_013570 [Cylindrospermopsis raciborskii Cr2010]|uniref:transposase family protein n=1 Tax=Cylindrospermopsis raciborskii TaxID=77022 RepID=UPI0020587BCD|nr:hypothetical protein C6N34_013570 [Cylindrospermopsis raciborskii Cr2010]